MGKRMMRLMVPALAGMLALSLGTAHAAFGVSIDTAEGATVWSLPTLPEVEEAPLAYPPEFPTAITGTASFDGTEATAVTFEYLAQAGEDTIVMYSGEAAVTCGDADENGAVDCTWSADVPFTFGPGDYTVVVTAAQPTEDPEVYEEVTDSVNVTVL
ncbi:MAG TPA: hypothetical protein VGB64_08080 [Actinomycetota bacterium]